MADLFTGFMFILGGLLALVFAVFAVILLAILNGAWRGRIKRAAKQDFDTDPRHLTTAAIEQQIERAVTDLNLWARLAVARGMRVDMEIAKADPDAVHPMGRYYVQVKAGEAKG